MKTISLLYGKSHECIYIKKKNTNIYDFKSKVLSSYMPVLVVVASVTLNVPVKLFLVRRPRLLCCTGPVPTVSCTVCCARASSKNEHASGLLKMILNWWYRTCYDHGLNRNTRCI